MPQPAEGDIYKKILRVFTHRIRMNENMVKAVGGSAVPASCGGV